MAPGGEKDVAARARALDADAEHLVLLLVDQLVRACLAYYVAVELIRVLIHRVVNDVEEGLVVVGPRGARTAVGDFR